jgi:hypothetical protein
MSPGVMAVKLPSLPDWKYFSFRRSDIMPVVSSIPVIVIADAQAEPCNGDSVSAPVIL